MCETNSGYIVGLNYNRAVSIRAAMLYRRAHSLEKGPRELALKASNATHCSSDA